MVNYIKTTRICRSKLIAGYFGAAAQNACGVCDNCINDKALLISKEEFDSISSGILQLIKTTALPLKEIQQQLKVVKKEKLWKVINYLQAENKITVNKEGEISI